MKYNTLLNILTEKRAYPSRGEMDEDNSYEEEFIKWLSDRLGKKIGKKLGEGVFAKVYAIDKHRVLRITKDIKENIFLSSLKDENIPGSYKVYSTGEIIIPKRFWWNIKDERGFELDNIKTHRIGFQILERINVPKNLPNELYQLDRAFMQYKIDHPNFNKKHDIGQYTGLDTAVQKVLDRLDDEYLKHLKKYYKEKYPKSAKLLDEYIKVMERLDDADIKWVDVHPGNFGRNSKGELVPLDIDDDGNRIHSHSTKTNHIVIKEDLS